MVSGFTFFKDLETFSNRICNFRQFLRGQFQLWSGEVNIIHCLQRNQVNMNVGHFETNYSYSDSGAFDRFVHYFGHFLSKKMKP